MKIAVIPARGGSKRIPNKNIRRFHGKPIIAYSIEAALESRLFDYVVVSTDHPKTAEIAKEYGAQVPFIRPAALADDYTGLVEVVSHCLDWFHEKKITFDFVCTILATAPFIQPEYLSQGFESLVESGLTFALPVVSFPYEIQRGLNISNGKISPLFPEHVSTRSQDLISAYHDAGQFYWARIHEGIEDKSIFSHHTVPIYLPRIAATDIDTEDDWVHAELLYSALNMKKGYS